MLSIAGKWAMQLNISIIRLELSHKKTSERIEHLKEWVSEL